MIAIAIGLLFFPAALVIGYLSVRAAIYLDDRSKRLPLAERISDSPYPMRDVQRVFDVFASHWLKTYGEHEAAIVHDGLAKLQLEWIEGACVEEHGDMCVTGRTWQPWRVQVATRSGEPMSRTALVHELIHVSLWLVGGDPIADHRAWGMDLVALEAACNLELMRMGL